MLNELNNRHWIDKGVREWGYSFPENMSFLLMRGEILMYFWSRKSLLTTRFKKEPDKRTRLFKAFKTYIDAMFIDRKWDGRIINGEFDYINHRGK